MIRRHRVTVTTDAGGDGIGYTTEVINGRVVAIRYLKTDYDNTADFEILGATTAISLNGIREALERSGAAHRRRESLPSEPASELEAKRPPPQPKMTVMGGSGGEMIKAVICVNPATTTTTNNDAAAAKLLLNWPKSNKQIAILFYFISSWSLTH